jgi:hypothetical protein
MAVKTLKLSKDTFKIIAKGISKPIRQAKPFFMRLAALQQRQTDDTFRRNGGRSGHRTWPELKQSTIKSKTGTPRIRYGTDGTPKAIYRKGDGKQRKFRSGVRRYGGTRDNILVASGMFRSSFKTQKITGAYLKFGTNFSLANSIMSSPTREVVFVTPKDRTLYWKMWKQYVDEGIKF